MVLKKTMIALFLIAIGTSGCSPSPKTAADPVTENTPSEQGQPQDGIPGVNAAKREDTAMQEMTIENGFQVDTFKTPSGKTIKFYCIKHGSLRIQYEDTEFEIDPVTDLDGVVTDYSKLPKADYILVTHEHYDHYDKSALDTLTKPSSVLITNDRVFELYGKGEVMANGDEKTIRDDIHLRAVPAYNTTPGHEKFHPKGRDNGFVLTLDGFSIYIAGDTEDIPEMADIKNIDVAFLPCNQPYTMTPEQLDKAARALSPKVVFPYHYGNTDIQRAADLLKDTAIDFRIRNYQ